MERLEDLSEQGHIDLFYGDESGVSLLTCIPYDWQFQGDKAGMPSTSGKGVNCFALISRKNDCWFQTTEHKVTGKTIAQWLDAFAQTLYRPTVVVLDNASVHQGKEVKRYRKRWEKRGLYVFYLPTYAPHLNLTETLWRKLKYEWLRARDYQDKKTLCYQVWQALDAVGRSLSIRFAPYKSQPQSVK